MKKTIIISTLFLFLLFLSGCVKQTTNLPLPNSIPQNGAPQKPPTQTSSEKSCKTDNDCACGKHKTTKQCFFGNVEFVDPTVGACPDFCGGIDGKLKVTCVNSECVQTR